MQKTNLKAKGFANKRHLKAYDHAWQAVWLGFASFVGKNKCVAPKAHETRFTVPMSSVPEALQRKAAVARCAVVSRIGALTPRTLKRCGATRDEYWSMSRILAPSASHRCLSSSLIARSGAAISRIRCTGCATTITTPSRRQGLHR